MSKLINLSEASILAIHSMVLIANNKDSGLNLSVIATELAASDNHLSKVLQRLVKAGLLYSTRGPKGGFVLGKSPNSITLLEIYEAIDGKIVLGGCCTNRTKCPFIECIFGELFQTMMKDFVNYFSNLTIEKFQNIKKEFENLETM